MDLASKFHHEVFLKSEGTTKIPLPHRTAGRLIEEAVELCLAAGETGDNILVRVADAILNEARKKRDKTGELVFTSDVYSDYDREEMITELADVQLLLDYLRFQLEIPREAVDSRMLEKVEYLSDLASKNGLVIIGGCVYRKVR